MCVLCIQHTLTYVHRSMGSLSGTLSFRVESYSFPQSFLVLLNHHFPRQDSRVWRGKKSQFCSGLLISRGPDGLCEVARNDQKIIPHFCALNSLHTKLCKLAGAPRSWNSRWNLHRAKLSWLCCINICVYFSSRALQADIWEEIAMGRVYISSARRPPCFALNACMQDDIFSFMDEICQILKCFLLVSIFENQRRWWPF